jgi:hypothetical protein
MDGSDVNSIVLYSLDPTDLYKPDCTALLVTDYTGPSFDMPNPSTDEEFPYQINANDYVQDPA